IADTFRTGQSGGTVVDAGVTVTDADSADQAGATVRITGGLATAEDELHFADTADITGAYTSGDGTLTLTGDATTAAYEAALQTVTYTDTAVLPDATDREITFTVTDSSGTASAGAGATKTIHVHVNAAPTLAPAGAATFTETAAAPAAGDAIAVAPDLTVDDTDTTNLVGATVTIGAGHAAGEDVLDLPTTPGIAASWDAPTGTLTLTGAASPATYQAALRTVTYNNTSDAPDTTDRTVTFVADDGETVHRLSAGLDRTVHVVATDDAPTAPNRSFTAAAGAVGNTVLLVHDAASGAAPAVTGPAKVVTGGLTTTATDPDGPDLTVVPATARATTGGGTVDLLADGDVVYHPAAGFTGSDTFTYTITDGATPTPDTATGTVTIAVATPVWYVDGSAAVGGDGRSDHPFTSLADVDGAGGAGDVDATGDRIFLAPGTYTGGLALENTQQLLGAAAGLTVPDGGSGTVTLVAPAPGGAASEVDGGVTLATGNTLDGVDLGTTGGGAAYALSGASAGHVAFSRGSIVNPAGGAISITGSGNVLDIAVTTLSATGGTGRGVWLQGASGTFTDSDTDGAISGGSNGGVQLDNDSGLAFSLAATVTTSGAASPPVSATNLSGGTTAAFHGAVSAASGPGIVLASNTGSGITFDGGVNVTSTSALTPALSATGGGVLTVGGGTNTLTGAGGGTLTVSHTTIGAGGLTFQSVAATNPTGSGIVLDTTGSSGGLTVTGTGTAGSGGTITGATGPGIALTSASGTRLTDLEITDGHDDGLRAETVGTLSLSDSTVSDNGDATGESGVDLADATGTTTLSADTITGNAENGVRLSNGSGTAILNVTGGTIGDQSGAHGNDGLQVVGTGSGTETVTVSATTFSNNRGDHVQVSADSGSTVGQTIGISDTTMSSTVAGILGGGIAITPGGNTTITPTISDNTISGAVASAIVVDAVDGGPQVRARITGNTINSAGADGIQVSARSTAILWTLVSTNQIHQYGFAGIEVQQGDGNGTVNASVYANVLSNPTADAAYGILAEIGTSDPNSAGTTDQGTSCLGIGRATAPTMPNTLTGSVPAGGTDLSVTQRFGTTVQLPGYTGGGVAGFLSAQNTGVSTIAANGTFVNTSGGSLCPPP
ncbi:MAG TPA: right-handed parallel beta-helix repeat-containing protein, partial [Baekduia sp.]